MENTVIKQIETARSEYHWGRRLIFAGATTLVVGLTAIGLTAYRLSHSLNPKQIVGMAYGGGLVGMLGMVLTFVGFASRESSYDLYLKSALGGSRQAWHKAMQWDVVRTV